MTAPRTAAERRGRMAEAAAALYLAMKGYRIVARRARTSAGEIDIVAFSGRPAPEGTLCFVEVKWRPTIGQAADAIQHRQRDRLIRAAEAFLQRNRRFSDAALRFDVVLLAPAAWPRHIRDAYRP